MIVTFLHILSSPLWKSKGLHILETSLLEVLPAIRISFMVMVPPNLPWRTFAMVDPLITTTPSILDEVVLHHRHTLVDLGLPDIKTSLASRLRGNMSALLSRVDLLCRDLRERMLQTQLVPAIVKHLGIMIVDPLLQVPIFASGTVTATVEEGKEVNLASTLLCSNSAQALHLRLCHPVRALGISGTRRHLLFLLTLLLILMVPRRHPRLTTDDMSESTLANLLVTTRPLLVAIAMRFGSRILIWRTLVGAPSPLTRRKLMIPKIVVEELQGIAETMITLTSSLGLHPLNLILTFLHHPLLFLRPASLLANLPLVENERRGMRRDAVRAQRLPSPSSNELGASMDLHQRRATGLCPHTRVRVIET